MQVVRAICDHDARLQDEINNVASGSGTRHFKVLSGSSTGTVGRIAIEGFSEALKKKLFAQIIERTRDFWETNFSKLQALCVSLDETATPA